MHHCGSWRIKDQLGVTCYCISLLMCSTYFRHEYVHHQELATIQLNHHIGHIFLGSLCVGDSVRLVWSGTGHADQLCNMDSTPTQPHWISNTHRTKKNTTNVLIQQNSRKFLMMNILISETCWSHKKLNEIASNKILLLLNYINKTLLFLILKNETITLKRCLWNFPLPPTKGSLMHTVNAGLQFTVPISQSFIFKISLCSVLAAPSCQFRPTTFEQTETDVK